jgi:exosortase
MDAAAVAAGSEVSSRVDRPFMVAVAALLLAAVYAPTAVWLWGRWTTSVWHNAHGLFIPVVVGYFVWEELKRLRAAPRSSSAWGYLFLAPALALHALDTGLNTQLLSAASIVIAAPGLALLFLGVQRTKAIAFPLAFLAFMLPIPLAAVERLLMALRLIATSAVAAIVPLFGIPIYAEGTHLQIANAGLEVADACSGFSTLYASLAIAFLTAYACPDWRRRVLLIVAAAPIAIGANIVRVSLLVLLVYWQGTDVLATSLHSISGLFTFALALPIIFWLGQSPPDRPARS